MLRMQQNIVLNYSKVIRFKFFSDRMVRTAKVIHNGDRVYGSRRNEQLPFKVLFISKKKIRQLSQENKFISCQSEPS